MTILLRCPDPLFGGGAVKPEVGRGGPSFAVLFTFFALINCLRNSTPSQEETQGKEPTPTTGKGRLLHRRLRRLCRHPPSPLAPNVLLWSEV